MIDSNIKPHLIVSSSREVEDCTCHSSTTNEQLNEYHKWEWQRRMCPKSQFWHLGKVLNKKIHALEFLFSPLKGPLLNLKDYLYCTVMLAFMKAFYFRIDVDVIYRKITKIVQKIHT